MALRHQVDRQTPPALPTSSPEGGQEQDRHLALAMFLSREDESKATFLTRYRQSDQKSVAADRISAVVTSGFLWGVQGSTTLANDPDRH
jgi:hypothetical protein